MTLIKNAKFNRPNDRRLICRRCGAFMTDFEPCSPDGEFSHPHHWAKDKQGRVLKKPKPIFCVNVGKIFTLRDVSEKPKEVEVFARKRERRSATRQGFTIVDPTG